MSQPLDPFDDVLGVSVPAERVSENLESYRAILAEIHKLRSLDLTDVHPAVVYDPLIPYRAARHGQPSEPPQSAAR